MSSGSSRVTGTVYQTNRCCNDHAKVGFGQLYVENRTDENGWSPVHEADATKAGLRGLYCRVWSRWREDSNLPQIQYIGPPTFDWNDFLGVGFNNREFRELMAYYHVTVARQRFGDLLSEALTEELVEWVRSRGDGDWLSEMRVIVDETGAWANNAAWDGQRHWIRFGADVPFVLDSVVTFHEYAHAIIDLITYPSFFPTSYETTSEAKLLAIAACEGYADYLACSLKDHPKVLECTPYMRQLDQPAVFDPLAAREPYRDSLSLSTGLWELRDTLGQSIVDGWVVQSLLDLRHSPGTSSGDDKVLTFGLIDAALAAIEVDKAINDSANVAAIERIFRQRQIL